MKSIITNNKKYFKFLLLLLFFSSAFVCLSSPEEEVAATQLPSPQISYTVTGNPTIYSTIDISVNITNANNIYGASLDFIYDKNLLEIINVKRGSVFPNSTEKPLVNKITTPGTLSIADVSSTKTLLSSGSLFTIKAKIKQGGTLSFKTTYSYDDLINTNNNYTTCIKLSSINGSRISYSKTDSKIFLKDIENAQIIYNNIPTSMESGKTYSVSVTAKNTGTSTWTKANNFKLGILTGNSEFNISNRILLNDTDSIAPGQNKTFNFTITAPTVSSDSKYNLSVKMIREGFTWLGDTSTKNITVSSLKTNNAEITLNTIPASMESGQKYSVNITAKNTGSSTWTKTSNIKLGVLVGNSEFNIPNRILLNDTDSIAHGQSKTFNFTITAPTVSSNSTYQLNTRMIKEGIAWFGNSSNKKVTVTPPKSNNAEITLNTIPTSMESGKTYCVSVTAKNTGESTWTKSSNIKLGVLVGNSEFNIDSRILLNDNDSIAPGQSKTFNFSVTAPITSSSSTYQLNVRMIKEGIAWFGNSSNKKVTIAAAKTYDCNIILNTIPTSMESGKTYSVSVAARNIGTSTWTKATNFKLGILVGNSDFNIPNRILLNDNDSIAPGQSKTFNFTITAPKVSSNSNYQLNVKMIKEGITWFGPNSNKTITVH